MPQSSSLSSTRVVQDRVPVGGPVLVGQQDAADVVLHQVAADEGLGDALQVERLAAVVRLVDALRGERTVGVVVHQGVARDRQLRGLHREDALESGVLDRETVDTRPRCRRARDDDPVVELARVDRGTTNSDQREPLRDTHGLRVGTLTNRDRVAGARLIHRIADRLAGRHRAVAGVGAAWADIPRLRGSSKGRNGQDRE